MKVFLAHSSVDKNFVRTLKRDLRNFGFDTWFDEDEINPGQSIIDSIQKGIEFSKYFCIALSSASVKSTWVNKELNAALTRQINTQNITVIPLLIERCNIPIFLQDIKYANFSISYNDGFKELIKGLNWDTNTISPNQDLTTAKISFEKNSDDFYRRGVYDMQEVFLHKAIEIDRDDANLWHKLGRCLFHQGLPANAIPALDKANKLYPHNKSILYDFGTVALAYFCNGQDDPLSMFPDPNLEKMGVLKLAINCLEECKSIDDNDAVVRYQLGIAYIGLEDELKAKAEFEDALRIAPDYKKAKDALELINSE